MTKEEILQMSQEENKGRDVVNIEVARNGFRIAWILSVCLAAVVSVVDAVAFGRMCSEALFVIMAGSAAVFWYKYAKLRKRHEIFVAVSYTVAAAAFLLSWILQMAGV